MMLQSIDINADLGEGGLNDAQLMALISSCNIACGGHFGNETTMRKAIQLAKKFKVNIGAHPSYPDIGNFGRKVLTMKESELSESVFQQLKTFISVCASENVSVHHIKLHGALYNFTVLDETTANAVLDGILATQIRPKLYLPYGSVLAKKAKNLFPLEFEAFIDRRYNEDGSLVSRLEKDAVITNQEDAWLQLRSMLKDSNVLTKQKIRIPIRANTFCIHSDTPNSVEILSYIRLKLHELATISSNEV